VSGLAEMANRPIKRRRKTGSAEERLVARLGWSQRNWSAVSPTARLEGNTLTLEVPEGTVVLRQLAVDPRLYLSDRLFAKRLVRDEEVRKERASELTLADDDDKDIVPFSVIRADEAGSAASLTLMLRVDLMDARPECRSAQAYRSMVNCLDGLLERRLYYFDLKLANLLCRRGRGGTAHVLVTDVAEVLSEPRIEAMAAAVFRGKAAAAVARQVASYPRGDELIELVRTWPGTITTYAPSDLTELLNQHQPAIQQVVRTTVLGPSQSGAVIDIEPGGSIDRVERLLPALRATWAVVTTWTSMTVALEMMGYSYKTFYKWPLEQANPVHLLSPPMRPMAPPEDMDELRDCAAAAFDATVELVRDPFLLGREIDIVDLLEP
jgi:hypothetical protein